MLLPIVNHTLKYNPSLDGLRGIAVTLVLLFHIWPEYYSFGYVGVDIFFVISGFLITQIIYVKLKSNTFSFKEFYRNRIRRIFPTVIIVLLVVLFIGYLFLFPYELEKLGLHIQSSVLFYQNFQLRHEVGYWDTAAKLKPLLHFWSLAIEEQFYLVWPIMIILIYKLRLNLFITLFFLFFFLLLFALFIDKAIFYHPVGRFWELVLGGLIYASSLSKFTFFKQNLILKLIIFILFVISIGVSYENSVFNVYKTFFLVMTTGMLILMLTQNQQNSILSSTPFVFLGLISFPLYLWHYIIISYMYIFGLSVQNYGINIIIISIILSYFTYRFVEFYSRKQDSYLFSFMLLSVALLIGYMGMYIYKNNGLPDRNHLVSNTVLMKEFKRAKATNKEGISLVVKLLGYKPNNDYIKATSDNLSDKYILIIGDSHAHTSYPGFAEEFKKKGYETILIANSSCPPYINAPMGNSMKDIGICNQKILNIYKILEKIPHIKKVLLITRGPKYIYGKGYGSIDGSEKEAYSGSKYKEYFTNIKTWHQKERFFEVVENTFNYLSEKNFDIYYILENPELGFSPKSCLQRPYNVFNVKCKFELSKYLKRAGEYKEKINKIAIKYNKIKVLDPQNLYCDSLYCYVLNNSLMMYADDDHHSIEGSRFQAKYFINEIINEIK